MRIICDKNLKTFIKKPRFLMRVHICSDYGHYGMDQVKIYNSME